MTWATVADVLALAGVEVDAATLAQAEGVVELFVGISPDNTAELSGANTRMLRAAVAYQAAWMLAQVDVTGRMEVTSLDQDGTRVTPGTGDDLVLAPLAKRAVARLSWMGSRSIELRRCSAPRYATAEQYGAAWMRDATPPAWRPL